MKFLHAENYYDDRDREFGKLDSAWAKAALYFRTGMHFGHPTRNMRCRALIQIHQHIEVYRVRFAQGDTLSLLHAVGLCADENLPLPTWLATAYRAALGSFLRVGGPASLDAVFRSTNLPTDTPKKTATARQDWRLGCELWGHAWDIARANQSVTSLDGVLHLLLSQRAYGVQITKARKLLLMVEKNQLELLGKSRRSSSSLSRFLANRRKA